MDCDICYLIQHNFFKLECCKNQICHPCLNLLLNSKCPFCRTDIPELKYKEPLTRSLPTNFSILPDFSILPMDDLFTESRIYRRYLKRMRKLQQREEDRENNKNLSIAFKNSKISYKTEIRNQIDEDFIMFQLDDLK